MTHELPAVNPVNQDSYDRRRRRWERTGQLRHHPDVVEGRIAMIRTIVNTVIAVGDSTLTSAGAGDVASLAADGFKLASRLGKVVGANIPTDLTPDVSLKWAIGTEALEVPTLGIVPTHTIESGMQFLHDKERIKRAREVKQLYRRNKR